MDKLIIHRKPYVRKGGIKVKASTFKVKDMGAKGRTPKSKRWAEFKTETGWKKSQPMETRYRKMLSATDKRLNIHDRYIQAGRMLNQLANVTTDKPTELKARADANRFFKKGKETKGV